MRVAIAHDYLTQRGGAEKVVLALVRAYPQSEITTTLYDEASTYPDFEEVSIRTTWLNRISVLRRHHRWALPFLAPVVGATRIEADCVIASSSGWAHGFRTSAPKVVYCYSPARWLYQSGAYLGESAGLGTRLALGTLRPLLKRWDYRKAQSATTYLAISTAVQTRILHTYGIHAAVVPAPHSMDATAPQESPYLAGSEPFKSEGYFLCISRLLPYKNVDKVVLGLRAAGLPLVVVGAGPEEDRLRDLAGQGAQFFKNLTDAQIRWLYAHSAAVVSASYEDFGLTPIEAACFGKPSIVLRWGGFLDTVVEGETGVFFDSPDTAAIAEAVAAFQAIAWSSATLKHHASQYSEEVFARRIAKVVETIEAGDQQA